MTNRKHDPVADFAQWPEPDDWEGWARMFYDDCGHLPDEMTTYDWMTLSTYLRILDDDAEGVYWRDAVKMRLAREPAVDEDAARRCWDSHLKRARWVCEVGIYSGAEPVTSVPAAELNAGRKLH